MNGGWLDEAGTVRTSIQGENPVEAALDGRHLATMKPCDCPS